MMQTLPLFVALIAFPFCAPTDPVISVATETQLYVPVEIKVINAAANSSSLIEVPGAAWERQTGDHSSEFTGAPGTYKVSAIYVEIVAGKPKIRRFTATTKIVGESPPGPGPVPPGPGPTPPPPTPVAAPAWAIVVEQTEQRTPTQAAVLGNSAMWQSLEAKGHHWRIYDADNPKAKEKHYLEAANKVGLPALIITSETGKLIDVMKMPETSEGFEAAMKKATGL